MNNKITNNSLSKFSVFLKSFKIRKICYKNNTRKMKRKYKSFWSLNKMMKFRMLSKKNYLKKCTKKS